MQIIIEATRGNSILDLILINRKGTVTKVNVCGQQGNSDHSEVRYEIKWHETFKSENIRKVPAFMRADFDELSKNLQRIDWQRVEREGRSDKTHKGGEGEKAWSER